MLLRPTVLAVAMASCAAPAWAEERTQADDAGDAAREAGHAVRDTARDIGHAARDAAREIGHATRDATREAGHAIRDTTQDVGHAVRDAVKGDPPPAANQPEK